MLSTLFALALAVLAPAGLAQDTPPKEAQAPKAKQKRDPIYDEAADGRAQIAAALARAKQENRRVLIQWGANWCGWCHLLHAFSAQNADVKKKLSYEYDVVLVDIGQFDKHVDIAASFGADLKKGGVPYLTILDAEGKVLANVETSPLEKTVDDQPGYDATKVIAVLTQHQAPYWKADERLDVALALAKREGKRVFLHFGAPWCGWCKKLETWMATGDVAPLLAKDFVDLKIDVDRMIGGAELQGRMLAKAAAASGGGEKGGGVPWFVFLDAAGNVLADSNGPQGNTGFPSAPEEIDHFAGMLAKVAVRITPADIDALKASLVPRKAVSADASSGH